VSSAPRRAFLGFFAALALAVSATGSAAASVYVGTSNPGNVPVHLFTNNKDKPTVLHYGRFRVPCTHGYRLHLHLTGAVPPFTRSGPGELFDRQHSVRRDGDIFDSVTRARQHGDIWRGRDHALWVFKDDGDAYTRCEFEFRFTLKPKSN
jgi:hypothetical protein